MKFLHIALAVLLLAPGCAPLPPPSETPSQAASAGASETQTSLLTLPPASLGRSLSLSQAVTADHDGKSYRMRYELEITPERLAMVGLTPLGMTVFSLVQTEEEITVELPDGGRMPFDPRHALFDLYIAQWPETTLRSAMAPLGMKISVDPRTGTRSISKKSGEAIATVRYSSTGISGPVAEIQHFDFPYRLRIETIRAEEKS